LNDRVPPGVRMRPRPARRSGRALVAALLLAGMLGLLYVALSTGS
jgi:hypothetical protein